MDLNDRELLYLFKLLENKKLSKDILEYLKNEKKGNLEEVKKIYELIN